MNGSTLYDIFIGTNKTMDVFVGNVNVRGVRCNCWQKQLTMMPIPMWGLVTDVQLLVDVFVTAEGVELAGDHDLRAPMRFILNGTISGRPFNHQYEIVDFKPLQPTVREALGLFGNCAMQRAIYAATTVMMTTTKSTTNPTSLPAQMPLSATTTDVSSSDSSGVSIGWVIVVCVASVIVGIAVGIGFMYWRGKRALTSAGYGVMRSENAI